MIRRREFIITVLGSAPAWPLAVRAQHGDRLRRIGVLHNGLENDLIQQRYLRAFREGLANLGWVEGRNLRTEIRWGAGDPERLAAHATELVALAPDVLVADAGAATRALQRATHSIPIVYMVGADPVVTGLVQNIARPEGNTTGFSNLETAMAGKWLELLKEATPGVNRVGLIFNPVVLSSRTTEAYVSLIKDAAPRLRVQTVEIPVRDPVEIVRAIDAFAAVEPNGGLIVFPQSANGPNRDAIVRLAEERRLPAIYAAAFVVSAGGLMSYAADSADQYRRGAAYVDRLLHGAKVSELPVQFPTKFELVVNLKAARSIGLTIPESFLLRADEVIQ